MGNPSPSLHRCARAIRIPGALLLTAALAAAAESTRPQAAEYEQRTRSRDGIGKFYFGREIAQVMGHQGAGWLERPEREAEEQPEALVAALVLKPGDVVADVGAGSGYFSWRMARQVGPDGRVYAVEIQQEFLAALMASMERRGVAAIVQPVLGTARDPRLPAAACDLILLVDVYHEFEHPFEMVQAMIRALKPGGRLVLVEYRGEDPAVPIKPLHKMTAAQVRRELAVHPLRFAANLTLLSRQHVLVFQKE
jgi:predicted methyltransferase